MRAVLMAAGVGRRISDSVEKPKSTLSVGDTTIIRHTVEMLVDNGIDVAVVVGYRKHDIYKALEGLPVTYFFSPFYKVTNSMASLWFAKKFLKKDEDVLLANADVYWEEDLLNSLLKDEHQISMLVDKSRGAVGDYCFELTDDGYINDYGKELAVDKKHCEYVGVAKVRGEFITTFKDLLEDAVENEVYDLWWENVLYCNCIEHPIFTIDVGDSFWGEVDVMDDYRRILNYIKNKN